MLDCNLKLFLLRLRHGDRGKPSIANGSHLPPEGFHNRAQRVTFVVVAARLGACQHQAEFVYNGDMAWPITQAR